MLSFGWDGLPFRSKNLDSSVNGPQGLSNGRIQPVHPCENADRASNPVSVDIYPLYYRFNKALGAHFIPSETVNAGTVGHAGPLSMPCLHKSPSVGHSRRRETLSSIGIVDEGNNLVNI